MELTKLGHSCVRLTDGDRTLVFDPGVFSDVPAALDGAGAVLVTHEHFDHVDLEAIGAALRRDPRLQVVAPAAVAAGFAEELGEQVVTVGAGEQLDVAGFALTTFGGQHALIHPQIPVVANVGFVVDGLVAHPGDSLVLPPVAVDTLLLPVMAPWSKASEVVDYAVSVRAPRVLPIHDALVVPAYHGLIGAHLATVGSAFGLSLEGFDAPVTVR